MKKKISVDELKLHMYIVELDRPWLETPFLFQGFSVKTHDDIEMVRRLCNRVYIDTGRGADVDGRRSRLAVLETEGAGAEMESGRRGKVAISIERGRDRRNQGTVTAPRRAYATQALFEDEIKRAREARIETSNVIENIFEDIRLGRSMDTDSAKAAVRKTAESIIRNPDAQLWLTQLKNKDAYTSIHSMNVCILSLAFGRYLGLSEDTLNALGLGALLHDVGKVRVPMEILNKPDKLSVDEFEIMKRHPVDGLRIVSETKGIPSSAMDVVLSHHERAGGSGYPRGLRNNSISLFSKVVAIVDVYDAITSDRIYHHGMDTLQATK